MPDFSSFMTEYGPPSEVEKPSSKLLAEYKGRVPDAMIAFWQEYGFGSYADGMLWVNNPAIFGEVLTEWLPRKGKQSSPIAVMRTAFGELVYWHKGEFFLFNPDRNWHFNCGDDTEIVFYGLFRGAGGARLLKEPQFRRAVKKFGPLTHEEIYGYKLPLAMGGKSTLANMAKMKLREHLSILAQSADPPKFSNN